MRRKLLFAIPGVIAGSLLWTATASAATISLEYADAATGGSFESLTNGVAITSGGFSQVEASATGVPPLTGPNLLATSTIDVFSTGAPGSNVLAVLITETGLTGPVTGFASGFGVNSASQGAVEELTYLNGTTLLSSVTCTGGVCGATTNYYTGGVSGPYSVTAEYIIALGPGQEFNGSINVSDPTIAATPIPGTLSLLATGLGLLGLTVWSRRKKMARSVLDNAAAA